MPVMVTKARLPSTSAINLAAERMEGKVRRAYLNAVSAVKSQVGLDKLARAIERGDASEALAILALDEKFSRALRGVGLEASLTSVKEAVQDTFNAGARAGLKALPPRVSLQATFDGLNPHAVSALENYTFNLISNISYDSRQAVQNTLIRAFKEGGHPYDTARQIRNVIGLAARQEQAVANYRAALEGGNLRRALDRSLRDGRYDSSLLATLRDEAEVPAERVERMVERYAEKFLDYRAETIARTETLRASNSGQRELWRQAMGEGLLPVDVRRRWVAADDERTCPQCAELDGETALLDEEFDPGIAEPPAHPDCRCTVVIDAESLGPAGGEEEEEEAA